MRHTLMVTVVGLFLLGVVGNGAVLAQQNTDAALKKQYAEFIDGYIKRNAAKEKLRTSSSDNLQRTAACAVMKKAFFTEYKEQLVHQMVRKNVGTSPHQMQRFLDTRFYGLVRPSLARR